MQYIVTRTSQPDRWFDDDPDPSPCEGAVQIELRLVERAKHSSLDEMDGQYLAYWMASGEGHTVVDGRCVKYFPTTAWVVELPHLSALNDFIRRNGKCVIHVNTDHDTPMMEIEIYDTWRE